MERAFGGLTAGEFLEKCGHGKQPRAKALIQAIDFSWG
jgi:hypothetical protein